MLLCRRPRSLRFFEDLKDMLGFTPFRFYYYMWKYITPILLLVLLCSSLIQLTMTPPSYSAWIQEEVSQCLLRPGINGEVEVLLLGKNLEEVKSRFQGFKVKNQAVALERKKKQEGNFSFH